MLLSMTGFAVKTLTLNNEDGSRAHVTMSLKSLNSRFFEATCKLPTAISSLETEFIKRLKEKLIRGYVVLAVQISNPNIFKGVVEPDLAIAKNYLSAIKTLQKTYTITGDVTVHDLIMLPNIFATEERAIDERAKQALLETLDNVTTALIETRLQEGKALLADLHKRITIVHQQLKHIENRAQLFMEERKAQIVSRLTQLEPQQGTELNETHRSTLFFELDKIDIHEELVRFNNHLATFESTIASGETEKGRRLDFILQELAREINTITAKCSDSAISTHAINTKVELEKAREQVQNIV